MVAASQLQKIRSGLLSKMAIDSNSPEWIVGCSPRGSMLDNWAISSVDAEISNMDPFWT